MTDLRDRTVLLTGASQGIGAVAADILGRRGATVIGHYRGQAELADATEALAGVPEERRFLVAGDYQSDAEVDGLWASALACRGHVDTLVLNAAMMWPHGGIIEGYLRHGGGIGVTAPWKRKCRIRCLICPLRLPPPATASIAW